MKRLLVAALLLAASVPAAGQDQAGRAYAEAYGLVRQAMQAEYMGKKDLAWRHYREARAALEAIRAAHPDWNSSGVEAQINACAEGIARNAPETVASIEETLGGTKDAAGGVGELQQRKVAFQQQAEWERRQLDTIERLMRLFARQEITRRVLRLARGAAVTEEQMRLAEQGGAIPTPEAVRKIDELEKEEEKARLALDPSKMDTDNDGLSDLQEEQLGTKANSPDTDGDGLTDGEEVNRYGTDPLNRDTDGDADEDGYEVDQGYDPLEPYGYD